MVAGSKERLTSYNSNQLNGRCGGGGADGGGGGGGAMRWRPSPTVLSPTKSLGLWRFEGEEEMVKPRTTKLKLLPW